MIQNSVKALYAKRSGEVLNTVSKTVPDQAMSIREILVRFGSGDLLPVGKRLYFDGDPDFDDIDETQRPDFDYSDLSAAEREIEAKQESIRAHKGQKAQKKGEPSEKSTPEGSKEDDVTLGKKDDSEPDGGA